MSPSTALTLRSDVKTLPAFTADATPQLVLGTEANAAAWRLVEAFSQNDRPFELQLGWSAGAGSGARALVTVASASRICVFARALTAKALNLAGASNTVGITVADGFDPTRNVWEHRGVLGVGTTPTVPGTPTLPPGINPDLPGDTDVDLDPQVDANLRAVLPRPPFAQRVKVELAAPELVAGASVEVRDASGGLVARVPLASVSTLGMEVGGAAQLVLACPGPTAFRAVYQLAL